MRRIDLRVDSNMSQTARRIEVMVLDRTNRVQLHLRRVAAIRLPTGEPNLARTCPLRPNNYGYHNAGLNLGVMVEETLQEYAPLEPNDPLWPRECACGYVFEPHDDRLFFTKELWRAPDGQEWTLDEAPYGAMWDAYWMSNSIETEPGGLWMGEDGLCLVVKTPSGEWWLDGPGADGRTRGWNRTQVDHHLTVTPSVTLRGQTFRLTDGYLITVSYLP